MKCSCLQFDIGVDPQIFGEGNIQIPKPHELALMCLHRFEGLLVPPEIRNEYRHGLGTTVQRYRWRQNLGIPNRENIDDEKFQLLHTLEGVHFGLAQTDGGKAEIFVGKGSGDESEQAERMFRRCFAEVFHQCLYAGGDRYVVGMRRNPLLVKGENLNESIWLVRPVESDSKMRYGIRYQYCGQKHIF